MHTYIGYLNVISFPMAQECMTNGIDSCNDNFYKNDEKMGKIDQKALIILKFPST